MSQALIVCFESALKVPFFAPIDIFFVQTFPITLGFSVEVGLARAVDRAHLIVDVHCFVHLEVDFDV